MSQGLMAFFCYEKKKASLKSREQNILKEHIHYKCAGYYHSAVYIHVYIYFNMTIIILSGKANFDLWELYAKGLDFPFQPGLKKQLKEALLLLLNSNK